MSARSGCPDMIVIGVDDTDVPGEGGTGRLARRLTGELESGGFGRSRGVTRHQLFQGPGVPMTRRNSSAAIEFSQVASPVELLDMATTFVRRESLPGSDPGVALLVGSAPPAVLEFAHSAQQGLVTQDDARRAAATAGIDLVGLAGTEHGVIGALSAAALRAGGSDGRFVGLQGIREVTGSVSVAELLRRTGIAQVIDVEHAEPLGEGAMLDVGDWVRPRLIGGRPVLVARREGEAWVNADARPA